MFEYSEAIVPSDHILEELITDCNQSFYYVERLIINVFAPALFFMN
ncbi:MAG: hypothetical protein ACR5KW_03605 [Wolbachia sp.]